MKIIRRICLVLIVCMISGVGMFSVSAENTQEYTIEGETSQNSNFIFYNQAGYQSRAAASKGQALMLIAPLSKANESYYYADYSVTVEKAGLYEVIMNATPPEQTWTSPLRVLVNNKSEVQLGMLEQFATVDQEIWNYLAGYVELKQGTNSLRFIVDKARTNDENCVMWIDKLTLRQINQGLSEITTNRDWNAFERGENIEMTFHAKTKVSGQLPIRYDVIDYYDLMRDGGTVYIPEGEETVTVTLNDLPIGHYTLIATMNGTKVYTYFAVMKPLAERDAVENTPFACDTASTWFAPDVSKLPGLVRLWKLAGIEWVRERVGWNEVSNSSNEISMGRYGEAVQTIADGGIKIMLDINGAPPWMKTKKTNTAADNIMEGYKFAKNIAEANDGNVGVWEVLNENDIGGNSGSEPADIFTAFQKAMYIGFRDAKTKKTQLVSHAGWASVLSTNEFIKIALENDLMKFSDVFDLHWHARPNGVYKDYVQFYDRLGLQNRDEQIQNFYQEKYHTNDYPIWMGEAGIGIEVPNGTEMSRIMQRMQARYLVTSTAESLSYGTDMHFFFLGTSYQENVNKWGFISEAGTPLAAVVAESVMTDTLKQGQYLGKQLDLPENTEGYWFDSGKGKVLVLWSTNGSHNVSLPLACDSVKVTEIMGQETVCNTNYGVLDITAKPDPVFITIQSEIPEDNLDRNGADKLLFPEPQELTPADRVVLVQRYDDTAISNSKTKGYNIKAADKVSVEVYNFNETAMQGTISSVSEGGWKIEPASCEVNLEPMSMKTLEFNITYSGNLNTENEFITFVGEFDGQKTSKSAAYVHARNIVYPIAHAESDGYGINAQITNDSNEVYETESLKISYAGETYESKETAIIQPRENKTVYIPLQGEFEASCPYPLSIELSLKNGINIKYESDFEMNILNQGNSTERKIDVGKYGKVIMQNYNGEEDLGGTVSVGADEENFYMEATIVDNTFSQQYSGYDMWNGDSIQFGISKLVPEGASFEEFGFGLTPVGAQLYRYRTTDDKRQKGIVTPKYISVKRNEAERTTNYALIVPWSEMVGTDFDKSAFKLSLLVNDNDGGGRKGYIEWGSGIGDWKNPGDFKDVVWMQNK